MLYAGLGPFFPGLRPAPLPECGIFDEMAEISGTCVGALLWPTETASRPKIARTETTDNLISFLSILFSLF